MTSSAPIEPLTKDAQEERKKFIREQIALLRSKAYRGLSTIHADYLRELEFEASSKGMKL